LQGLEGYVPTAMVVLMLAVEFVPALSNALMGSPILAVPIIVVQSAGYYLIAYY
jgi:hypothetical protein